MPQAWPCSFIARREPRAQLRASRRAWHAAVQPPVGTRERVHELSAMGGESGRGEEAGRSLLQCCGVWAEVAGPRSGSGKAVGYDEPGPDRRPTQPDSPPGPDDPKDGSAIDPSTSR